MPDRHDSTLPPAIPALLASIEQIDLMLRQANCVLMYAQPRKPGKITLHFPKGTDGDGFAIPAQPRPVQWHLNRRAGKWYTRTIPPTHLSKRAKGAEEFGTGYHATAKALSLVQELLGNRQRAVAILRSLAVKAAFYERATKDWLGETSQELARTYVEHSHLRRGHGPNQAEWEWFSTGGSTPYPGSEADLNDEPESDSD